jgi:hypothetical protein
MELSYWHWILFGEKYEKFFIVLGVIDEQKWRIRLEDGKLV